MNSIETILGIDPGCDFSGIVILEDQKLIRGNNLKNDDLFSLIDQYTLLNEITNRLTVVYEDIRPYTSRFNMTTINTCKMIGRLEYILNQRRIAFKSITRNEVKAFVFSKYREVVVGEIEKKILKKGRVKVDGDPYKPSFQYVDDRLVQKAMKVLWKIPTPKPGKVNQYGVKTHAWQALGAVSAYMNAVESSSFSISDTFGS